MKRKFWAVVISALLCLQEGVIPSYAKFDVTYAPGNISIADAFGNYKTTGDLANSFSTTDSVTQISLASPSDSPYGSSLKITENSPVKGNWYTVKWDAISGRELSGKIQANFSVYIDGAVTAYREFAIYGGDTEISFLSFRNGQIMRVDPGKITEARTTTSDTYDINTWYNVEFKYDIDTSDYYVAVRKAEDNSLVATETLNLKTVADSKYQDSLKNFAKIDGFGFQSRCDDEAAEGSSVYIDNLSIKNIFGNSIFENSAADSVGENFKSYENTQDLANSFSTTDNVTQISLASPSDSPYGSSLKITENEPTLKSWYTVKWNAVSENELRGKIQVNFSVYIDGATARRGFAVFDGTTALSFITFHPTDKNGNNSIQRVDPTKIGESRTAFSTAATYETNTWYNVEFTYDLDEHAYYVAVRNAADNSLIAEETLDLDDATNIAKITKIDGFGFQSRSDVVPEVSPSIYIDNLLIKRVKEDNEEEENTGELVITKSTPVSDGEDVSPSDIEVEFSKDITSVVEAAVFEDPDGKNEEVYSSADITADGNKLTIPAESNIKRGKVTYAVKLEGVSDGTQNKNFVFRFTSEPEYVLNDIKISHTDTKINASVIGIENDGQGRSYKLLLCEFDKDTHILTNSAYKDVTLSAVKSTFTTPSIDYKEENYYEAYLWDNITAMNAELKKEVCGIEPFAGAAVGNAGFVTVADTGVVTASGQGITGERKTVLVLKPGKAMGDISVDNLKDTVCYIKQFDNASVDAFSFIPGTLITDLGKYGFALNGSFTPEAFMYYPPAYYSSLYEKINAADIDLKYIVDTYKEALSISAADLSYFTGDELAALNTLFITERNKLTPNEEKGYYIENVSTFENIYKETVGRALAKKGLMEIAFTKYGDALKENTYKAYVIKSGFDAENISEFYTLLSQVKGKETLEEIENAYNEKTILFAVKTAKNQIFVENAIIKTNSYLNWDLSVYEGLDNKSAVNEKLRGVGYETIDLLKQDFDKYVDEQKIIEESNKNDKPHIDNGGSIGGGGGGIKIKPTTPIAPTQPAQQQKSFSDMENHTWAHGAVEYLSSKGIINGKGNNSFAPADAITREEFIKIVVATFSVSNQNADCSFDDVDKSAWYYESVSVAYSVGLINGQSDTIFGVGKPITREDMAVMIYRAAQKSGISFTGTQMMFDDAASVSDYAKEAVSAMSSYGVINGVGGNKFAPKNIATRAEAAKMIYEMMVKGGMA